MSIYPMEQGAFFPPSIAQESPNRLDSLTALPDQVIIQILSRLPQPLKTSLVCRRMSVLAHKALEAQLLDKGLSVEALRKKWGDRISAACLTILLRFHVDIASLARMEPEAALKELRLLLDNNLDLLHLPNDLLKFLQRRLLDNTLLLAQAMYVTDVFNELQQHVVAEPERSFASLIRAVKGALWSLRGRKPEHNALSSCTKKMKNVINFLRNQERGRSNHLMLIAGDVEGSLLHNMGTVVPMQVFALPPFELLQIIRHDYAHRPLPTTDLGIISPVLALWNTSIVPQGVSSMDWIEILYINYSSATCLPEEIGKMKIKFLAFSGCDNLESLPSSLIQMPSLECVGIFECPKLKQENPVIKELVKKGVFIDWNNNSCQTLVSHPFSESLHNFFAKMQPH